LNKVDTTIQDNHRAALADIVESVLRNEAQALLSVVDRTSSSLVRAATLINGSTGTLIVSGVGKSGHVGRKIASTFCSLGKRAAFLHAAEASHGDLGIIDNDSIVLVLSNSGETPELSDLLAYCREYSIPIIGITASASSTLGKASEIVVEIGKLEEACVNGLAPTTSTTVALAVGDAIAVGVSHLSGIEPEDFRRFHPGGKLGASLLTVNDIMHSGTSLPMVRPEMPMQEVVVIMSEKGFGTAIVCEGEIPTGIITDGDMRRNVERLWQSCAMDLLLGPPKIVSPNTTVKTALQEMNEGGITCVAVADDNGELVGLLHIHDCLSCGAEA